MKHKPRLLLKTQSPQPAAWLLLVPALPRAVVCSVVCLAAELVTQFNHLTVLGSVNQGFCLLAKVQCVQGCRQDRKERLGSTESRGTM